MNSKLLLAHFDRVSDAPNAVPRLRRFILDLAVRGKLVEQNPSDEPASDLLVQIGAERARRVGSVGAKSKPVVVEYQIPFSIPQSWAWTRLVEIGVLNPRNKAEDSIEASFVPMPLIPAEYGVACRHEPRPWGSIKNGYTHFADGDVGLAKITPCFENGKSTIFRNLSSGIGAGTTELHIVRPIGTCAEYVLIFLKSPYFIGTGTRKMTGTAGQKRVPAEYFAQSPFPLPPLAEQHRIVAKVDELMALCDRLEAAQAERENRRDRLTAGCLQRLRAPTDDGTGTRAHASFFLGHLPRMTARPNQIPAVRQAFLNLAAHGRLVPQNRDDEPASELLSRIKKQRDALFAQGYPSPNEAKAQAKKQQKQVIPSELPTVPPGWQWATLLQCAALVVDCHNKTAPYSKDGIVLVRTTNVRGGMLNSKEPKFVDEAVYSRWSARCRPEPGDILITREAPMGEVCRIPPGMKICLGQRMMLARVLPDTINPAFLLYSLRDPLLLDRVQDKPVGATVEHLRVGGVETLLVPVPPVEEQRRIVAKLDELLLLCDQLEFQLTTMQTQSHRFLQAFLQEILDEAA